TCYYTYFFFSSRRRHTRSLRDWSSDVCSSDLANAYLTKTTDPDEIYQAILTCMNNDFYFNDLVNKAVLSKLQNKRTVRQFYPNRSEERRVGKECRSRWSPYQ